MCGFRYSGNSVSGFASSRLVGGPSSAGRGDAGVRDTLRVNVAWLFRVDFGLS